MLISLFTYTSPPKRALFSMEKQIICLPRSNLWAKYSSQNSYKTIKTRSCLSTEERYLNYCLPRRLPNSGLLCRRFKSQHVANIGSSTLARVHHKVGEIQPGTQPFIEIPGSLHRLTSLVALPEKKIMNI